MTEPTAEQPFADDHDPALPPEPTPDPAATSIASGVASGSALRDRPQGDTDTDDPDRKGVVEEFEPVNMDDDEAIAYALAQGRRDLIDVSKLDLKRRMQFGLLTQADDEARVRGDLGNFATTGDQGTFESAERTNVGEGLPGRE